MSKNTTSTKAPRYTDEQLAQARTLRAEGLSWPKVAKELGIKAPYRLKMRVERQMAQGDLAPLAGADPKLDQLLAEARKPYADKLMAAEALLRNALAEKRTSGPLKSSIREYFAA